MSSSQTHELVSLMRRLDSVGIKRLRSSLPGAKITTTRLRVSGRPDELSLDPLDLLSTSFDVLVSSGHDGSRRLAFRLPASIPEIELTRHCTRDHVELTRMAGAWILDIRALPHEIDTKADDALDLDDHDHDPGWLDALAPLHGSVCSGDRRALYLAWLHGACVDLGGDELEPAVPSGLRSPSRALEALVDFLYIDPTIVSVAARHSAPMLPELSGLSRWIEMLPTDEKDAMLLRFVEGDAGLASRVIRRYRDESAWLATSSSKNTSPGPRTVGELRLLASASRSK